MAFTRPCGVSVCCYLFPMFAGASSPSFPCRCAVVTHRALYVVLSVWSGSCPMHTYRTIMWLSTKGTYVRTYVRMYIPVYILYSIVQIIVGSQYFGNCGKPPIE